MSSTARMAFGGSIIFTTSMIAYVHWNQQASQEQMREGVRRDFARIEEKERKKAENLKRLEEEQRLTKALYEQRERNLKS
uniref:Cytochrome c oxidase assembly protein n=1 Tax=Ciona intestinalis TaxID=7719 RepID=H2XUF0_CIOIN